VSVRFGFGIFDFSLGIQIVEFLGIGRSLKLAIFILGNDLVCPANCPAFD
jgi:hypothetical protein